MGHPVYYLDDHEKPAHRDGHGGHHGEVGKVEEDSFYQTGQPERHLYDATQNASAALGTEISWISRN